MTDTRRFLLRGVALAAFFGVATSGSALAGDSLLASSGNAMLAPQSLNLAAVTLDNQQIVGQPGAAVVVNALSSTPQTGSSLTVNAASNNDVVTVRSTTGTPAPLQPVLTALQPLNPVVKNVVGTLAGTLAKINPAATSLLGGGNTAMVPVSLLGGGVAPLAAASPLVVSRPQTSQLGSQLGGGSIVH